MTTETKEMEIPEALASRFKSIARRGERLTAELILARVEARALGLKCRAVCLAFGIPVSLVNATDYRVPLAERGIDASSREASATLRMLGLKPSDSIPPERAEDARAALGAVREARKETEASGTQKTTESGTRLSADERMLAAIAANKPDMTESGIAAAIAALEA